ncbi:ECF subfamily RNA polymerase sigma factor [Streptantibioticus cattleyicolor NRRL 8057 = DSM 46488]|uniref:ECF subfamily RNA polymerase sigma factor n=2 Tax=Streptantibioticus cattleyicolor TaxID=29303 RepID=F8K187_STREN|nr:MULTISPECIES: SigE family RNA polymerase sigma factor [Streptomycetaceae]AEW96159.1 ECF subfamily RNA polymerase sigma factor [Streptantibioticus cattleyicolor NRRL 8057 = DSM 46488]MYS60685.1 SigE family RNA polymerase sigma factor [Streptomyces sp. SID5468]CCB76496.1 RNA polymerase sigma-E factor (modular protein) [Streptantibioticus cattleyicolor NRRL 8057 = DSM 46488]
MHTTTSATDIVRRRPHSDGRTGAAPALSAAQAPARGRVRGTARPVPGTALRNRAGLMTAIDGGAAPRPAIPRPAPAPDNAAEADFTAYVTERRAALYATAYHLTGDRHEAEDLLQNALFSTYRAWDRISDKAAVGGYLRRTMTNLHISAWRRRKLNEYPTEELPETAGDADAMRGTELRAVLWQALAKLPEPQRTMLVLRYYEGRTDPEIADILGISIGTVKSSIWRSLRRLRDDEVLSQGRDFSEAFGELVA